MSLLLLFPLSAVTSGGGFTCWSAVATQTTTWGIDDGDFFSTWGDWGTTTWGAIMASGYTWEGLAGFTFQVASTNMTTWVTTTGATSCGPV